MQTNKQIKVDIPAGVTVRPNPFPRPSSFSALFIPTLPSPPSPLLLPLPPQDGTRLRIRGEGDAGQRGGPPGDLYVFVSVEADKTFKRDGLDLLTNLKVDYLGTTAHPEVEERTAGNGGK